MYENTDVPEYHRIAFTRFRVCSHNLKIEMGRWSRIPRNQRLCTCEENEVQTEQHALLTCPLTANIRRNNNITQNLLNDFFDSNEDTIVAESIYRVLRILEDK